MDKWLFLHQFFVTLFAYIAATACGIVLAEHSSAPMLGEHIVASVRTTCDLIPTSLSTILEPTAEKTDWAIPSPSTRPLSTAPSRLSEKALEEQQPARSRPQRVARDLRSHVGAMRAAYKAYSLDIVHARHAPSALRPVIKVFGRLQRNALLMPTGHVPGERIRTALERAYATPLSPAVSRNSRSSSRMGTPRRAASGVYEPDPATPTTPTASIFKSATPVGTPTASAFNSAASMRSFHLQPPPMPRETAAAHLARELSKVATHTHGGSRIPSGDHEHSARRKLTTTCGRLSDAITAALQGAATLLTEACEWHWRAAAPLPDAEALLAQLDRALDELQKRLSGILDSAEVPMSPAEERVVFEDDLTSDWLDDEDRFRIAFFMIALLDLARDTRLLLQTAGRLHSEPPLKRWHLPPLNWPWSPLPDDAQLPSIDREVPTGADDPEFRYNNREDLDFVHTLLRESKEACKARPRMAEARTFGERATAAWRFVWDRSGVVLARVLLSQGFHALKHSRHVHFALKQTIGISLLSLPAFLPVGNGGRDWYDATHGAWMVVSFMYVLEVTTGATLRVGFYRMCGTFIGAVLGYIVRRGVACGAAHSSSPRSPTSIPMASSCCVQRRLSPSPTVSYSRMSRPWPL